VSKHFGADMSWFFEQWVYNTPIPKISIEYSVSEGQGGAVLTVDAKQQNVPDTFRSVLPLLLHSKKGVASGNLVIAKPSMHAELKLPEKPDSVEFNPLYALLCELEVKKR